ncbi:MAG: MCP four helix bundle domain-containing protein [Alphaproteobacteria bacterium]|nr:MCP four helix bundle domain-containing protein [Alphaproteobacteria bacterium]
MNRYSNLPLFWQLLIPMALVTVLWVLSATMGVHGLMENRSLMHGLYNDNVKTVFHLDRLRNGMSDHTASLLRHLATEQSVQMERFRQDMRDARTSVEQTMWELRGDFSKDHTIESQIFTHIQESLSTYLQLTEDAVKLSADFEKEAAFATFNVAIQHHLNRIDGSIRELHALEEKGMEDAYGHSVRLERLNAFITLFTSLGAGALSVFILGWIARRTSRRLKEVADCAAAMGNGDLQARPNSSDEDEIGDLGRGLALMAGQLEETMAELQGTANQLRVARDKLANLVVERTTELESEKKFSALQKEFVSLVSHEFRTPLAIIDGSAQRIMRKSDAMSPDQLIERGKTIRTAVERMVNLIDTTLFAARLDEGRIDLLLTDCDLKTLFQHIIGHVGELSPLHRITLTADDGPIAIMADPKLLEHVLTNLLSNAIKYAPNDPRIEVGLHRDGKGAVFTVRDYGVGIPEGEMHRMFERYFRARTALGIKGTGLGLSVCREFVEMHGGTISVESEEGKGACFTVRLPGDGVAGD